MLSSPVTSVDMRAVYIHCSVWTVWKLDTRPFYKGESSRSGHQRNKEHAQDLREGLVTSPIAMHTVKVHGGVIPQFLAILDRVEPGPMYRIIRESIEIEEMSQDIYNMNRYQELTGIWGGGSKSTQGLCQKWEQPEDLIGRKEPQP